MSCNVTSDKDIFGPVYELAYTTPNFGTKLHMHWGKDQAGDKNYINKTLDLFCSCLQGVAANKWDLCTIKYKGDERRTI